MLNVCYYCAVIQTVCVYITNMTPFRNTIPKYTKLIRTECVSIFTHTDVRPFESVDIGGGNIANDGKHCHQHDGQQNGCESHVGGDYSDGSDTTAANDGRRDD